jgi:hypothetical protein
MYVGPQVGSLVDLQPDRAGAKSTESRCLDSKLSGLAHPPGSAAPAGRHTSRRQGAWLEESGRRHVEGRSLPLASAPAHGQPSDAIAIDRNPHKPCRYEIRSTGRLSRRIPMPTIRYAIATVIRTNLQVAKIVASRGKAAPAPPSVSSGQMFSSASKEAPRAPKKTTTPPIAARRRQSRFLARWRTAASERGHDADG